MTSLAADLPSTEIPLQEPAFQAFRIPRVGPTVTPILFGRGTCTACMVDRPTSLWSGVAAFPAAAPGHGSGR